MENFSLLKGTDTLKNSRETLNNNMMSLRSLSSGTAFPTDNLSEGMLCYRTDLKRLYQYQANGSWSTDVAMSISGNANTANSAGTAANADHADTADTADVCTGNAATATTAENCTGNSATASKLKSAVSINKVSFDGSKNIEIPVGVKTVNGIEPTADGDVVVDTAGLSAGLKRVETMVNSSIAGLSVSGNTITCTKHDGTTFTITISSENPCAICSTAANTASKVVTVTSGTFALSKGVMLVVTFSKSIGSWPSSSVTKTKVTLNVNSTGAKNILCGIQPQNTSEYFMTLNSYLPAGTYMFFYDGTQWQLMGQYPARNSYNDPNSGGT